MQERPKKPSSSDPEGQNKVRDENRAERGPEIDPELQAHIGRHLKASYDDILGQNVPDRFLELLQKLEDKEGAGDEPKGGKQ